MIKIKFLNFKKEKHFKKKEFVFNTNSYWQVAVFVSLAIVVSFGVFGYYLFLQTSKEAAPRAVSESGEIPMIKTGSLEKALGYFSERAKKTSQILNSPSPVVDPSL